jgi:hypothetical protein
VIDWSTYNGSTVLGFDKTNRGPSTCDLATSDSLLVSVASFTTGWRLPNLNEMFNIMQKGEGNPLNYFPFSVTSSSRSFWTSTAYTALASWSITNAVNFQILAGANTTNRYYYVCRTFTVTGTTLS